MWIDALGYYLFVNEGIEELLLEMQKFYFAFLIDTNKWKNVSSNSFSYAEIEPNRDERNRMNQFLKRMSQISGNPIIPEISRYTARLSDWIRVFSRPASLWLFIPRRKQSFIHMNQRKLPSRLPTSIRLTEVRRLKGRRLQLLKTRSFGEVRFIRLIMQRRECSGSTGQH